jgi:hypothetical protein
MIPGEYSWWSATLTILCACRAAYETSTVSSLDYPSHLQHLLLPFYAILAPSLGFLFYLINPYSSDDKSQNLQCQWPQQQRLESTTSWLVVGHADLAFKELGENATSQIIGATTEGRPYQERQRMMLERHWTKGLRSNAIPLVLCKLDIRSTRNNPWVRRATLVGISLVLSHYPDMKEPNPT